MGDLVLYTKHANKAMITLNRPQKLNALNMLVLKELEAVLDQCEADQDLRVLLMKGAAENFASGADISMLMSVDGPEGARQFHQLREQLFNRIENLHCPTIALVDGYALGSGLELALSFDFRIGTTRAKFGVPSGKLGIVESYEYISRLTSVVGPAWAKEMLFTAVFLDAPKALELRLINRMVPPVELENFGEELAEKIIKNSPHAVKGSKLVVNQCARDLNLAAVADTGAPFIGSIGGKDFQEGTAAFFERRKPNF